MHLLAGKQSQRVTFSHLHSVDAPVSVRFFFLSEIIKRQPWCQLDRMAFANKKGPKLCYLSLNTSIAEEISCGQGAADGPDIL